MRLADVALVDWRVRRVSTIAQVFDGLVAWEEWLDESRSISRVGPFGEIYRESRPAIARTEARLGRE